MKKSFKSGAASFYIVAFTTLILLVVSLSFASVVISLVERASNSDLSQSAYDSAMAGVEDAKTLFFEYRKCKSGKSTRSSNECKTIMNAIDNGSPDCNTLNSALGVIGRAVDVNEGVLIKESSNNGNNMQQMYTCLKIKPSVGDVQNNFKNYGENKVVKITLEDPKEINNVKSVWLSWGQGNGSGHEVKNGAVVFPSGNVAPPVISVALVQTSSDGYSFEDFEKVTNNNQTDLGTVFLVPVFKDFGSSPNYNIVSDTTKLIGQDAFLNSNRKTAGNIKPYVVKCDKNQAWQCSVGIELPEPIGKNRSNDNFMFVLSYYGSSISETTVGLRVCKEKTQINCTDGAGGGSPSGTGILKQTSQFEVDSTGRANDLYRRVVSRFNYGTDSSFLSLLGPLELKGSDKDSSNILKPLEVIIEHNFK